VRPARATRPCDVLAALRRRPATGKGGGRGTSRGGEEPGRSSSCLAARAPPLLRRHHELLPFYASQPPEPIQDDDASGDWGGARPAKEDENGRRRRGPRRRRCSILSLPLLPLLVVGVRRPKSSPPPLNRSLSPPNRASALSNWGHRRRIEACHHGIEPEQPWGRRNTAPTCCWYSIEGSARGWRHRPCTEAAAVADGNLSSATEKQSSTLQRVRAANFVAVGGEPGGRGRRGRGRAWGCRASGCSQRRRRTEEDGVRSQEIRLAFASGCWRALIFGCVVFHCARPKPTNGSRICIPSVGDSLTRDVRGQINAIQT
jgi:hypothetical protein